MEREKSAMPLVDVTQPQLGADAEDPHVRLVKLARDQHRAIISERNPTVVD